MGLNFPNYAARAKEISGMATESLEFAEQKELTTERLYNLDRANRDHLNNRREEVFSEVYLIAEQLLTQRVSGDGKVNGLEKIYYLSSRGKEEFSNQLSEGLLVLYKSTNKQGSENHSILFQSMAGQREGSIFQDIKMTKKGKNSIELEIPTIDTEEGKTIIGSMTSTLAKNIPSSYGKLTAYKGVMESGMYGQIDVTLAEMTDVPLTRDIISCYRAIDVVRKSGGLSEERYTQLVAEIKGLGKRLAEHNNHRSGKFDGNSNSGIDMRWYRIKTMFGVSGFINAYKNPNLPIKNL